VAVPWLLAGCGGGGSPAGPAPPPPEPTFPVGVVVFHDEDGDGRLDGGETARIPNVQVRVGSSSATTAAGTGRAVVMAPGGAQTASVDPATLPPFFAPGPPVPVQVPTSADLMLPLRLPIGDNRPGVYLAYGDSITLGEGSSDGSGYVNRLESKLRTHFGDASVFREGRQGRITESGVRFIEDAVNRHRPAYTLIMMGTNDWNLPTCQDRVPCEALDNLRQMVRLTRARESLPVLATIPPANPAINDGRNDWVSRMNDLVRPMAAEEGAAVADVYAAFQRAGDLPSLFADQVHPNDAGYEVIAQAFFEGVSRPRR
jgi:lysophospholipase L1-like esterase